MQDAFGNPVTTTSTTALDSYDRAVDAHLHAWPGAAESLDAALADAPDLALAHALRAVVHLGYGQAPAAKAEISSALSSLNGTTARERSHVELIAMMVEGRGRDALQRVVDHAERYPTDVLAASTALGAYGLFAFSGRADHNEARLAFTESLARHVPDDFPWMLSYRGWARIEAGGVEEGLAMAQRAIALRRENAHNAHSLMHGWHEAGDPATALAFIDEWLERYPDDALMWGHLNWHAALNELALEREDAAVARLIGPMARHLQHARPYMSMIDWTSLLWRLGLRGVRGLPVSQAHEYVARNFASGSNVFGEMHLAMMAIATKDRTQLDAIRRRLEAHRDRGHEGGTIALHWIDALGALIDGDLPAAQQHLDACWTDAVRIGGSGAQRQFIDETRKAMRVPAFA